MTAVWTSGQEPVILMAASGRVMVRVKRAGLQEVPAVFPPTFRHAPLHEYLVVRGLKRHLTRPS